MAKKAGIEEIAYFLVFEELKALNFLCKECKACLFDDWGNDIFCCRRLKGEGKRMKKIGLRYLCKRLNCFEGW